MTTAQSKNLVLVTGGILVAGSLLTHHYTTSTQHFAAEKGTFDLGKKIVAIGVLIIVMSFMADQVPDFTGPLALLILVAYVSTHLNVFNEYVKGTT